MAKMVNATFVYQKTRGIYKMTRQIWHLPCLPYIYSSVFTYLRHICKEKICANPFFVTPV